MATTPIERSPKSATQGNGMERRFRDERFRTTVYSMNTLLGQKGIYSPEEFELQFRQLAQRSLG